MNASILLAALLTTIPAQTTPTVVDVPPGTYILRVTPQGATITTARVVTLGTEPNVPVDPIGPEDPPLPTPPTTTMPALTASVRLAASLIDDDRTKAALAAGYLAVADKIRDGTLKVKQDVQDVQREFNLAVFGQDANWLLWGAKVNDLLGDLQRRGQLNTVAEMELAWRAIASGLAPENATIDVSAVVDLIEAIISKDRTAIRQAVVRFILALIGGAAQK